MGIDRYLKEEDGIRKYIELMECMPTAKRQTMMNTMKAENSSFVETAEKYLLTFDRICHLPELELTEVLSSSELKSEWIATAVASIKDLPLRERFVKTIPRNRMPAIAQDLKDNPIPKPFDVGNARLSIIKIAREIEKQGNLVSMQIPKFERDYFQKKAG